MARKQPKQIIQMTVAQFEAAFPNEEACDAYLVARRWPNGVIYPRCGSDRPYELKTMKFKWECPAETWSLATVLARDKRCQRAGVEAT